MDRRYLSDRQRRRQSADALGQLRAAARALALAAYERATPAEVDRLARRIVRAALAAAVGEGEPSTGEAGDG